MRTVSVSEGRKQFSTLINWADENGKDVIVQNYGEPKAVIISIEDYELLQDAREKARLRAAVEELKAIAKEVRGRNPQFTPEEADKIADEITREAIQSLIDKGEITFEAE